MTEARDKALAARRAERHPTEFNPDTEFTLGFDVRAEEVGRLERYNDELKGLLADAHERYVRDTDILFIARKAAERERDAALAVIELARRHLNPNPNGVPLKDLYAVRDLLATSPANTLAEHDRTVKAEALEDAAVDIVLTPVAEWKRHGNPGIRENAEADASAWMDARAAEIRAGNR